MAAYAALERGETNPLSQLLSGDDRIVKYMDPAEVRSQLDPRLTWATRRLAPGGSRSAFALPDRESNMQKGREITRGKTKILFEAEGQPDLLVVQQMDAITAGDSATTQRDRRQGRIAAKTTARVFNS